MSILVPIPALGDRWRWTPVPESWADARLLLNTNMNRLAGLLDLLQPAIELRNIEQLPDRVPCSADTALTVTGITDITGVTETVAPDVDLHALVVGTISADCTVFGAVTHRLTGYLYVNGSEVSTVERMVTAASAVNDRRHMTQSWVVPLTSGQSYEFKLRAGISDAATQWNILATHTGLTFLLIPNLYNPNQPIG